MATEIVQSSRDWLSSPHTNTLAWWIPKAAILAALFIPPPARTEIWNHRARLDGYCVHSQFKTVRTHPLPLHGPLLSRDDCTGARACFGVISVDFYAWLSLAVPTPLWAPSRARA